jgi:hypothetical protein
MGLNIKNPNTEAAIRALATARGVGLTEAVDQAVSEALGRGKERQREGVERRLKAIREIQARIAARPIKNPRSSQEIVDEMYGEFGEPI